MTYDSAELRDSEELPLYGENLARALVPGGFKGGRAIIKELRAALRQLSSSCAGLAEGQARGEAVPPAAQWLLDNHYLARREGAQALLDLKGARALPQSDGEAALLPLCRGLIRSGGGRLSEKRLELFFTGCQQVYVLSRREKALLLPVLRAVMIEELAQLYAQAELNNDSAVAAQRLFTSLRLLSSADFTELLNSIDFSEQLFLTDPAGVYPQMAEKTREAYKRRLEKLARKSRLSEHHLAEQLLRLSRTSNGQARHIGYYLFTRPLGEEKKAPPAWLYILCLLLLSHLAATLPGLFFKSLPLALLSFIPAYSIVKALLDRAILRFTPPAHIPRMELSDGVPAEGRTLCVITALLSGADSAEKLAGRLEQHRLASRDCGENLLFGILADLPDSAAPALNTDEAALRAADAAVTALNERYGGGFFLFARHRSYNESAGRYMAWERKRGALTELARHLSGLESGLLVLSGNSLGLRGVSYILTLDEDTRLSPGSARELIGAMLHPLNTPVIDEEKRIVTAGHGLIHPRIFTELSAVNKTPFSRLFAPQGGSDPYGGDCSELYMDAFQNGGFAGKGIISVAALIACLDGRLPENTVLSHDALEGAYLRGGFMGDAELSDSFPAGYLSYQRRAHRWMRGDTQNSPWLFSRGRSLTVLDRFRLGDSIRRALEPAAYMAAIALAFFLPAPALTVAALLSLLSMSLELLMALFSALFNRAGQRPRTPSDVQRAFSRLCYRLLFLPDSATNGLCALFLSLWRLLVSHRHMLDWTTAGALERGKSDLLRYSAAMLPSVLLSALFLLSPSILGRAAGAFWLLAPLAAFDISRQRKKESVLTKDGQGYILQAAGRMWSYFDTFCTAREHYLPPDNFQKQPDERVAHRSSPTNIGLCLVSCLCAIDLSLTARENALGLIENILATLRRLPKWKGNLYNWYDTQSLRPLHPAYVSTVDCGNLVASLIVLRQGLSELSQERLAAECDALLSEMSLAPFYDEHRRLFSIGYDAEKEALSDGCYDLMASEAQITSFIAIARGDVPCKHWRQLSRAMLAPHGRRAMASWTGSMFEYLMPRLFFPARRGSLLYETQRSCVAVQRSRTAKSKLPWGVSESAFFSLDASLSYRYKAHGCAALALKRGMDDELVVSPYSSLLALPYAGAAAVKNLRALEKLGTACGYGFWEAADFTPARCDCQDCRLVKCVMAHHIGMSIIAITNALCDEIIPRRLMAVPSIAAHSMLLEEKLPQQSIILRRREKKAPQRPGRGSAVYWERRGEHFDPASPVCCVLSNGVYSSVLTDGGISRACYRGIAPYSSPRDTLCSLHGIDLHLLRGESLIPLLPSPDMPIDAQSSWEFTFTGAKISSLRDGIRSQVLFSVHSELSGEKRTVSVSGEEGTEETAALIISLRPLLLPQREYSAHPAFAGLGIHAQMHGGALILRRLARGETPETYMCLAASEPLECSARGELIPGRGGLLAALRQHLPSKLGWLSEPYVFASIPIRISGSAEGAVSVALTVGGSESEVYSSACRMLTGEAAPSAYPAECASRLSMTEAQADAAMQLLGALCYPALCPQPRSQLWKFGISGDLPVLVRQISGLDELPQAQEQCRVLRLLCALGQPFDLVLLCSEGGDYLRPVSGALSALRQELGAVGSRLHIIEPGDDAPLLESFSARLSERSSSRRHVYALPERIYAPAQSLPQYEYLPDGSFRFEVNASLPPRAWSNVLTNGRFGYFAADCGSGFMWYKNSREYAVNRRPKSLYDSFGGETLHLDGQSLFALPEAKERAVTFGCGWAKWEAPNACLTAFVPMDTDARVFIVQWDDGEKKEITWFTDLILGGSDAPDGVSVSCRAGAFKASAAAAPFENADFFAFSSGELTGFTARREAYLRGDYDEQLSLPDCLALRFSADCPFVLVCGCDEEEKLLSLRSPAAAIAALERTRQYWESAVSPVELQSPLPALDRLINTWLPYQALACRLMARCSLYQSGGATGFRDQLQDAVNLIILDSSLAKQQILLCCRHQYAEGDVMHWWHTLDTGERGVRTRCSDDLLWLPWALCGYVQKTGDTSLCRESAPFLISRPLEAGERDRYEQAGSSPLFYTVLEHAAKAIDLVLSRGFGSNGLLKIGSGDWNDGFSAVGSGGLGESVWLSFFCSGVCESFASLLKKLRMPTEAEKYLAAAQLLGKAAVGAWDGAWFLRGSFDDGSPLGSSESSQCRIDSLSQSFAALCPYAASGRVNTALSNAVMQLFDERSGTISLFTPPFESASPDPGYIQSYGPGFRENGGQYTHAAVWLVMALLRQDRRSEALRLLSALIPEQRDLSVYEAEPFVLAADVYTNPDCAQRAGWSWYTGAAGWLYRVVTQELLGLQLKDGALTLSPRIPREWDSCHVRYRSPTGGITDLTLKSSSDEA